MTSSMPYRDDTSALQAQVDQLRARAHALDGELRHQSALASEREQVTRALAEAEARLDERHKHRTPFRSLKLRVASPCDERWDDMRGDARTRHCARCAQDVHNLSDMTVAEAEAFLRAKLGANGALTACSRVFQRADGTIIVRDQHGRPVPVKLIASMVAGLTLALVVGSEVAASHAPASPQIDDHAVAGQMMIAPDITEPDVVAPTPAPALGSAAQ